MQQHDEQIRIVVTGPMKSASTFTAEALRRYFGAELSNRDLRRYYWTAEQNITQDFLDDVRGRSFAVNLHVRPYRHNLEAARAAGIRFVVVWRNLADVIVSFDDHIRADATGNPMFYVADRARYLTLARHDRYAYLIDNVVPWNIGFYLAWRREGVVLHAYEQLVRAPLQFIDAIVRSVGTGSDRTRLAAALPRHGPDVRFNVGTTDRAAVAFSEANRRHLERVVIDHPQRHELEILLWELPWAVPALKPSGPFDGKLVTDAGGAAYFVSRNVRRRIPDAGWLASRRRRPAAVRLGDLEIDAIPEGLPLV